VVLFAVFDDVEVSSFYKLWVSAYSFFSITDMMVQGIPKSSMNSLSTALMLALDAISITAINLSE
jgi:hypothetical protein